MNSAKKLFFLSIALILVLACVPTAVTPVPPLDPNAINTMIVETSAAALTRTLEAVPSTFTAAPTLRNTLTPEPTFTNVPVIVFPTGTPIENAQYFRVRHDDQLARYDYKSRTAAKDWDGFDEFTPETVPLFSDPQHGTYRTIVDGTWEIYIDALNNQDKRKLRYLKHPDTALFNHTGFPKLESLTMGGNVITLIEVQGGWGRVNTINYYNPGTLKDVNYFNRPDLVHKFVVVVWDKSTKSTYWVNPPPGDIYWPFVASTELWIPMDRIEPFPTLPRVVIANTPQDILRTPSRDGAQTGLELVEGESIRIVKYQPMGPDVWALTSSGHWIALLLDRKYLTDWEMETVPPP